MNPMSEKKLEKMLRQAPSGGDLDRAVQASSPGPSATA